GLKDRCRKDRQDFKFPRQIGKAVLSTPNGIKRIKDWFSYADELPTIETEMNRLIRPTDMDKSIYIIHMPPSNLLLDVCSDGSKVGSLAIYDFLKKNQPLLSLHSLHGHIHESPDISGKWRSTLNKTICIQPGQSNNYENFLIYVIIDFKKMKFERIRLNKND
ncbi:MAG: metallophosphoesterase family protein, partial [Promethearchaeota archaeon]